MKILNINKDASFSSDRPTVKLLMETDFTKEIGIFFNEDQVMKKHQTPFPIVVQVMEGKIDFRVEEELYHLIKGDLISLDPAIPHDLRSLKKSIIRLTLLKTDSLERVEEVANN